MASEQYGMTGAGFIPKRLADIQSDLNLELANIVDPSTGEYPFQNAADDAILQQVVGVFASALEALRCSPTPLRARRAQEPSLRST